MLKLRYFKTEKNPYIYINKMKKIIIVLSIILYGCESQSEKDEKIHILKWVVTNLESKNDMLQEDCKKLKEKCDIYEKEDYKNKYYIIDTTEDSFPNQFKIVGTLNVKTKTQFLKGKGYKKSDWFILYYANEKGDTINIEFHNNSVEKSVIINRKGMETIQILEDKK